KVGSTYRISSTAKRNAQFTRRTFKVVGFVNSPTYVENTNRGVTNIGKGTLDYLVYVRPQVIKSSVITRIDVQFKNLRGVTPYTAKYRRLNREN
ncbi:MAG: ABC transporter permease, partial [Lactiplantibacillus plantarum]